jgi:hypothetical protein
MENEMPADAPRAEGNITATEIAVRKAVAERAEIKDITRGAMRQIAEAQGGGDDAAPAQRQSEEQGFAERHPQLAGLGGEASHVGADVARLGYAHDDGDARISGMSFSGALAALKNGERCARDGWNGKGQFVFMVAGSTFQTNREPLVSILGRGVDVSYRPHLDIRAVDGTIGVWTPSQTDLFAGDWFVVDAPETVDAAA